MTAQNETETDPAPPDKGAVRGRPPAPCSTAYLAGALAAAHKEEFDSPFIATSQNHRDWVDGYQDQQAGRLIRPSNSQDQEPS